MFHAEIEATSLCNTRCLHCPHEDITRPGGKLTWETYTTVVDKIRSYVKGERYSLSYSGMGEPLLNPLIYKFVKHVSQEATTAFSSNGAVLTEANVLKLIDAGLDTVYVSFNGDEPEIYSKMMGGLNFERALSNVRRAVELARGTRLKIRANVSITKANQDRVSRIHAFLEKEEVGPVSFSLCHNRGGHLKDEGVCDTPAMPVGQWACDVMKNTLTVDWQGKVHICEHDLDGHFELGDLMTEPLEVVLERRQRMLADNSTLSICHGCNDLMRAGGTPPLDSVGGGLVRDWVYYLHKDMDDPLSEANPAMRWLIEIYKKEGRLDRMVNRLIEVEKASHKALQKERTDLAGLSEDRKTILRDKEKIQAMLDERDLQYAALNREFESLHQQWVVLRRDPVWRFTNMVTRDIRRFLGFFRKKKA